MARIDIGTGDYLPGVRPKAIIYTNALLLLLNPWEQISAKLDKNVFESRL